MPDPVTGTLGALSIGSSFLGADAAKDASRSQQRTAQQGINEQRDARLAFEQRTEPFRQLGLAAAVPLLQSLGIQVPADFLGAQQSSAPGSARSTNQIIEANVPLEGRLAEVNQQLARFASPTTRASQRQMNRDAISQLEAERQSLTQQIAQNQNLAQINDRSLETQASQVNQQGGQQTAQTPDGMLEQVNPLVSFLRDEGFNQIQESAAAQGNLRSGGTLKDLTRFNTDLASTVVPQLQQQRFNQLFNLLGIGQNAATGQGSAALNTASNISSLLGQSGAAAAQGQLGQANAIQGGIGDIAGLIGYTQARNRAADPFMSAASGYQFSPTSDPFSFGGF